MAKDKSLSKEERRAAKKAAKTESTSLAAPAGVTKTKSDKKEKKDKKDKKTKVVEKALKELEKVNVGADGEVVSEEESEEDAEKEVEAEDEDAVMVEDTKGSARPIGALVPFANPLADEKVGKKVFKGVKKAAASRTLKRGVKEVVKALRKSAISTTSSSALPLGIVVLAADISPMDVISHIPVLCEDHNIPYIYVTSRAELGMAGQTKRPTSVVMVSRDLSAKKGAAAAEKDGKKKADDGEDWEETYKGLVKVVQREGKHVKI